MSMKTIPNPPFTDREEYLVLVERRYNSAKLREVWFWEIFNDNGYSLNRLIDGECTFGWARSEAHAYRQVRRIKKKLRELK